MSLPIEYPTLMILHYLLMALFFAVRFVPKKIAQVKIVLSHCFVNSRLCSYSITVVTPEIDEAFEEFVPDTKIILKPLGA